MSPFSASSPSTRTSSLYLAVDLLRQAHVGLPKQSANKAPPTAARPSHPQQPLARFCRAHPASHTTLDAQHMCAMCAPPPNGAARSPSPARRSQPTDQRRGEVPHTGVRSAEVARDLLSARTSRDRRVASCCRANRWANHSVARRPLTAGWAPQVPHSLDSPNCGIDFSFSVPGS